jgi:hypothetical protein
MPSLRDTIIGIIATLFAIAAIGAMYIDYKLSSGNRALQSRIAQRQTIIGEAVQGAMHHAALIQFAVAFAQQSTNAPLLKVLDDHGFNTARPTPPPGGMPRMQRSWPQDLPADATSQDGQTSQPGTGAVGATGRPAGQGGGQPGRPGSDARR